jgi:hypothetical protein
VTTNFELPVSETAWGHFLIQFEGKPYVKEVVTAIFEPLDMLAKAYEDLRTKRGVETAEGKQLDGVGEIVGVSREIPQGVYLSYFGFREQPAGRGFGQARMRRAGDPIAYSAYAPDSEFRQMIKAKIRLNNSFGSSEDIIAATREIFMAPAARVKDMGNATAQLWIGRPAAPDKTPYAFYSKLIPRAAGVRLIPIFFSAENAFGFREQGLKGFGVGIMARSG